MWNVRKTCSPVRVANFSGTEMYFPLFRLFHILSLSTFNFSQVLQSLNDCILIWIPNIILDKNFCNISCMEQITQKLIYCRYRCNRIARSMYIFHEKNNFVEVFKILIILYTDLKMTFWIKIIMYVMIDWLPECHNFLQYSLWIYNMSFERPT